MKFYSVLLIFLFLIFNFIQSALCSDFGSYNLYNGDYRGYALQQTLQGQKNRANIARQKYNYYSNPTRNIQYPTSYNPYPNIQKNQYSGNISKRQRYSSKYYETMY